MALKYDKDVAGIQKCPPADATSCKVTAFRFVFANAVDRSFVPVAKINPSRQLADEDKCAGQAALSMFSCPKKAANFYRKMISKYRNFYKLNGTHLGEVSIDENDGVATTPRKDGHFAFFEFATCNLESKCKIYEELYFASN